VSKPVDKYGDKAGRGLTDECVSPYLMRPLRSLARVLASRTATEDGSADRRQDSFRAETRPAAPSPESGRPVTD